MPPITIQTDKPINPTAAAKPDGVTPQTASSNNTTSSTSQYQPPPTTVSSGNLDGSVPARPGAAAMPAPTSSIQPPPPQSTQSQPSPTRTSQYTPQSYYPPPPQPGAVPQPFVAPQAEQSIPPPPRAGDAPIPPQTSNAPPTMPPPQFSQPPPTVNAAATYSTTTYQPPGVSGITGNNNIPSPFQSQATRPPVNESLAHPPGYVQNPYADTMTPAQRAATEKAEQEGSVLGQLKSENKSSVMPPLGGGGGSSMDGSSGGGLSWDAAKRWIGEVGGKVAELEGEVWKKIDGK